MLNKGELLDLSREKKCKFWRERSSPEMAAGSRTQCVKQGPEQMLAIGLSLLKDSGS